MFMDTTTQYVKMLVPPNLTYRFNTIPIKIPARYFVDINKLLLKFIWRDKRTRIVNTEGEEQSGRTDCIWLQDLL